MSFNYTHFAPVVPENLLAGQISGQHFLAFYLSDCPRCGTTNRKRHAERVSLCSEAVLIQAGLIRLSKVPPVEVIIDHEMRTRGCEGCADPEHTRASIRKEFEDNLEMDFGIDMCFSNEEMRIIIDALKDSEKMHEDTQVETDSDPKG